MLICKKTTFTYTSNHQKRFKIKFRFTQLHFKFAPNNNTTIKHCRQERLIRLKRIISNFPESKQSLCFGTNCRSFKRKHAVQNVKVRKLQIKTYLKGSKGSPPNIFVDAFLCWHQQEAANQLCELTKRSV